MDLSIIIVNWNSGIILEKCLSSIYKTKGIRFETFVVDNASSDQSLTCLKKFYAVKLIQNKKNLGFTKANNQAIRKAKGRYVLLLNPDTVVLKNSLKSMVKFLNKNKAVGVLGCKLLNHEGSIQPSCHAFLTIPHVFFEVSQLDYLFPKNKFFIKLFRPFNRLKLFTNYLTPDKPVEVDSVMGSCYMTRKEALKKTGLLDENFFLYHEEMELSYRLWQKGYKVMFYPYASVIHKGKHSTEQVPNLVYYERCRSILHFFRKHKRNQLNLLKITILFALAINLLSLPFRRNFKESLMCRMRVTGLLNNL
jgi:hypothetical protein